MDQRIEAIYENGVFKPLGEVLLPEHFHVVLRIANEQSSAVDDEDEEKIVAQQRRALAELDEKLKDVPYSTHTDGLSSEDHDRILYGGAP